jgi:hypothetical protein
MLDKEPLSYPSRAALRFPYAPGVPDRQLWAIGMIVVQWSMTETLMFDDMQSLMGDNDALADQFSKLRNFRQRTDFWETLTAQAKVPPVRDVVITLIGRVRELKSQRDTATHGLWGGGMQGGSWAAGDMKSTDASILRKPLGKPLKWHLTFSRARRLASDIAHLNRDLFVHLFGLGTPPIDENDSQIEA